MKDYGMNITQIELDELLPSVMSKKMEGWRLAQICSVYKEEKYELSYSFARDYEMETYRVVVDKSTEVPSITGIYDCAFLGENEIKELFGVNMEFIGVDYHDKLYRIEEETPFLDKEDK